MRYNVVCKEHRGLLSIRYPMEHGIIRDWNDMERIWHYIFSKEQLQTFSEEVFRNVVTHQLLTNVTIDGKVDSYVRKTLWVLK